MSNIENIVIGNPIVDVKQLLTKNDEEWDVEFEKTLFTQERFLPKILVELGIFKSNSDVKRNRPELFVKLVKPDYMELKIGRRRLFIVVGKDDSIPS